jgi:hypothetical protein
MTEKKRPSNSKPATDVDVDPPAADNDTQGHSLLGPQLDDVTGHGLLHEGFQRPPATSRNADRTTNQGCRTPTRTHPNRRETR